MGGFSQSCPSAPVRELVSGYPRRLWPEKLLVVMQAFIDDSAWDHGDKRYYLAGYINTAERWAQFSNAWDACLRETPSIKYFHAVEAENLRGEFKGWSQRQKIGKVVRLAKVIQDSSPWGFATWVNRSALEGGYTESSPYSLRHPFQVAFWGAIYSIVNLHEQQKMSVPVDLVFDEQRGQEALATVSLDWMVDENSRIRKVIGASPIFRSDKDFLPLQAADMLAWHIRRDAEGIDPPNSRTALNLLRFSGRFVELGMPDATIQRVADSMSKIPFTHLDSTKTSSQKFKKRIVQSHAQGYRPLPHGVLLKKLGLKPNGEPKLHTRLFWRFFGMPDWARRLFRRSR